MTSSASPRRHIHVNAFHMNCVGHIHHGLWAHPQDRSTEYHTLKYWTDIAQTLERGLFDGLFMADVIGYYDVYQQGVDVTLRQGIQLPVNNPWLLVSAMAAVTQHLGFGLTATVGAHHPYTFARDVSTLDQLTGGRVGWNIVTGYVDSGARGLGLDGLGAHDRRYDQADDFLTLAYKLWEGSWHDDAVRADKAQRLYVQPDKVQPIAHEGPYYRAHAIHMSAPSPQRTPVLFQAGTSARGMQFAGQHGEGIFIGASSPEAARETSRKLRAAAVAAGRRADDVKIYVGLAGAIACPITTPAPAGATRRRPGLRCRQWRSSRHALALQTLSCFFLRRGLGTVVGRAAVVAGSDKDGAAARSRATAIA